MGESMDASDKDNQESVSVGLNGLEGVTCTTFNILAPIYKRLDGKTCESEFREFWLSRNESILDRLLYLKSAVICLQEFWVTNEELVRMYEKQLGDAGYLTYKLARTNNRGDGLLTAVQKSYFNVLGCKELLFNDFGDRVAQILHVELLLQSENIAASVNNEALIVNTHLLFPHDLSYCFHRLHQVYKILQYIESYCHTYQLPPVPIILCGDWNGSKKGNVYKFLRSQGFVSSYDVAHQYTDSDEDSHKWISHRNHRGNICGVDFIWLLNPNKFRKPLKQSFTEAVLGNIMNLLHKMSAEGADPLHLLEMGGNKLTYSQFSRALTELGLCGDRQEGMSTEYIKDLWGQLDVDEDGVIDVLCFDQTKNTLSSMLQKEEYMVEDSGQEKLTATIGFQVKKALLFPPEVEQGMWPDHYNLSDHAHLTVEFLPRM
ncbi:Endonuclease/exonuclease/phosphatase [Dillenia turbinata]|uniref:Endonuclease/exonuclease/phosphatase n=1 Tax=Dillenia turbinata TaxID=194707 RepID=A0AAN8ZFX6_9MAGN